MSDEQFIMTVSVIGVGLDGAAGLTQAVLQIIEQATLLVGSDRLLSYFPQHLAERLILGDFKQAIAKIKPRLETDFIVVLVSGDPLLFGLGRLLVAEFPPEQLTFYPHLSSVQLAFNRVKVPWNDAQVISAHGRSLDELIEALRQGFDKIAVLTDGTNTPSAIARLISSLDLPCTYQLWVCENLGGDNERVQAFNLENLINDEPQFSSLNVVILLRQNLLESSLNLDQLPLFGLPDSAFLSFRDRPGLMTKREVRILILGELALQPNQIIWDIGAGTGSVSIEIARLFPTSKIYAIEKTAAGTTLIEQNCQRFSVNNVVSVRGTAPDILAAIPSPHRIFIGGTGGNLKDILAACNANLVTGGVLVMALATLEHLNQALEWLHHSPNHLWSYRLLQVNLSRSVPIANLTRFSPLNPVTILTATQA